MNATDVAAMPLNKHQLPSAFAAFDLLREIELTNATLAGHLVQSHTEASLQDLGRISGFVREFAIPAGAATLAEEPSDILMCGTVAHNFDRPESVSRWIDETFVRDLRNSVGVEQANGHTVAGVEILNVSGFHGQAAGLLVLHEVPNGTLASTVVDFQIGSLLGVSYVTAKRDMALTVEATEIALSLEQQMVKVVLGSA
jgi:hypothetical protein